MLRLTDWPIRRKLALLTGTGAVAALLLACLAMAVHNVRMIRTAKAKQITALADILGFNAVTSLEFLDADTAAKVLSPLRLQPSVELAVLFDANGQPFATYPAELPDGEPVPTDPATGGAAFTADGHLTIAEDIHRDGDKVGTIYLRCNMQEVNRQLAQTAWIILGVMVVALGISMLVTGRLQRLFTGPIEKLATAMDRVTAEDDVSLRVPVSGRDELGVLCSGFNRMLGQIEEGRGKLQEAHHELEDRVAQRTAQLSVALETAESANRAKSDFLANMSHEIRTPMTAVLGYAEILSEEENLSEEGYERATAICRNGHHLLRIINDILDVSKMEAGRMTVERIECSPCEIVADVASLMRARAAEKGLALDVTYRGPVPETIRTDPTRLHQILVNLIGNAVKFSESGSIGLAITAIEPAGGADARLGFEITDTGQGMSAEQLDKVFNAFTQADESTTRRFGGTGLGLTISKGLTKMLGGALSVESAPGHGSTFRFTVETGPLDGVRMLNDCREAELSYAARRDSGKPQPVTGLSARVLLCEDGKDNQRLIAFLLEKAGACVTIAEDGRIGSEKALAAREAGRPFDVILMDMQMPVCDGYGATRRLRQEGYEGPIVALTAHAMKADRDRCLAAGCDDYMTKPIDRNKLLSLVARHAKVTV